MPAKKAVIIVADKADLIPGNPVVNKFIKRSATISDYQGGDIAAEAISLAGCKSTDPEDLKDVLSSKTPVVCIDLGSPSKAKLESVIAITLEAADQHSLIIFVTQKEIYFYGFGIKRGKRIDRTSFSKDIIPTICYVTDHPLPENVTGAILYQVLKDRDMKRSQIKKLKDALIRLEAAMEYESLEPWDRIKGA